MALLPFLWGAGVSRLLFGLGNAAAMTLIMAWLVAIAPPRSAGCRRLDQYVLLGQDLPAIQAHGIAAEMPLADHPGVIARLLRAAARRSCASCRTD